MNLPSLTHVTQRTWQTVVRFPMTLVSAAAGTVIAMLFMEGHAYEEMGVLQRLLLVSALGIPLFTALAVLAESQKQTRLVNWLYQIIGVLLLALYYVSLPEKVFAAPDRHLIRFFLLNIGLHFLVAIIPYLERGEINGFWQYNKTLFLRFLTAALFSAVLFIGLFVAVLAIKNLFDIAIPDKRYGQLWVAVAGIFNTWFFLAGIPENLDGLEKDTRYPRGLKIFTQYILIPLVVLYLIILYAYGIKIIADWEWPQGWVANLVLTFSVVGILALLLVYPIQERPGNRWIKGFAMAYYLALIPLIAMLFLAIWRRLSEYGITENRYFVLILALCLTIITFYFIFSPRKNIKLIPELLCSVAFLSSFGPWGAFYTSESSQVNRLEAHLQRNNILLEGSVRKVDRPVPFEERREISAIIRYLHRVHGLESIQPWFEEDLSDLPLPPQPPRPGGEQLSIPDSVLRLMGLSYVERWQREEDNSFYLNAGRQEVMDLAGYDYLLPSRFIGLSQSELIFFLGGKEYTLYLSDDKGTLTFYRSQSQESITVSLLPMTLAALKYYDVRNPSAVPVEDFTVEHSNGRLKLKIYLLNITGERAAEGVIIRSISMDVLVGRP